jgi:hypothetical protein
VLWTTGRSAPRLDGEDGVHRHGVGACEVPRGRSASTVAIAIACGRSGATAGRKCPDCGNAALSQRTGTAPQPVDRSKSSPTGPDGHEWTRRDVEYAPRTPPAGSRRRTGTPYIATMMTPRADAVTDLESAGRGRISVKPPADSCEQATVHSVSDSKRAPFLHESATPITGRFLRSAFWRSAQTRAASAAGPWGAIGTVWAAVTEVRGG